MKQITLKLLSAVLCLGILAGCGGSASGQAAESTEKTATPANKLEAVKQSGVLTVAISPDFGPYEFMDLTKSGEEAVVGCEVELAKYIADYLGVTLKIEQMDFATCQAAVSTGKVDMSVSGYAKTEERAQNMECSQYYNWESSDDQKGQGLIVLKENAALYSSAESFAGKTIAAQNGSLQTNLVNEQLPSTVNLEPISTINDGILMLINGKVDALASSYSTGLQFCKNYDQLAMADFKFEYTSQGNVVLATKGETELMAEINAAIAKAQSENKFETWLAEATELCNQLGVKVN